MGSNIYNTKIRIFWGMRNYYIFLRVHEKSGNEELGKQTQHPQVLEKKIQISNFVHRRNVYIMLFQKNI